MSESENENNKIVIPSIEVFPDQIQTKTIEIKPQIEVNKIGRPLEYKPIYVKKAFEYLQNCKDEWEQIVKNESEKGTQFEIKNKVKLPSLAGLSIFLGVTKDAMLRWEKIFPKFGYALKAILAEQEQRLINNGLGGQYDSRLAGMILAANHGIRPPIVPVTDIREVGPVNIVQIMNFTQQNITTVKKSEELPKTEEK